MRQTKHFVFLLGMFLIGAPALAAPDADARKAIALFKIAFEGRCAADAFTPGYLDDTEGVAFDYRDPDNPSAPETQWKIYSFFCDRFHNSGSAAFILKDREGRFQVMTFAMPSVLSNAGPDQPDLMGFMTTDTLINGEFNPEDLTIFSGGAYDPTGNYYTHYKFIYDSFHFVEDQQYVIRNGKLEIKPPEKEEGEE
jgi:hypothetical protein